METTLILFVYVIVLSKWSFWPIFDEKVKGGQNIENSQQVPLDFLEVHVLSNLNPFLWKLQPVGAVTNNERKNDENLETPIETNNQ